MSKENRIWFPGNPWKQGHPIREFEWTARLVPGEGIYFDLHLKSADYYSEEDLETEEEDPSDWESPAVWGNYHQCIMSSTYWGAKGLLAGTEEKPLDFAGLEGQVFTADPLPLPEMDDHADFAFNIYLLGHDSCADHRIEIVRQREENVFDLRWRGKIALSYAGDEEFRYSFDAHLHGLTLSGLTAPEDLSQNDFEEYMDRYARNWMDFPGID